MYPTLHENSLRVCLTSIRTRRSSHLPSMMSLMICDTRPTMFLKIQLYTPPSVRVTPRSCSRLPWTMTFSDDWSSLLSLNHDNVGSGVAEASQNRSTVSPSFWMRKLGDTSPRTGGAGNTNTNFTTAVYMTASFKWFAPNFSMYYLM